MTLVLTSALAQGLLWSILAIGIYISYRILNAYTTDRDYLTMRILMKKKGIRFLDQYQGPADTLKHINWEKWKQKAGYLNYSQQSAIKEILNCCSMLAFTRNLL